MIHKHAAFVKGRPMEEDKHSYNYAVKLESELTALARNISLFPEEYQGYYQTCLEVIFVNKVRQVGTMNSAGEFANFCEAAAEAHRTETVISAKTNAYQLQLSISFFRKGCRHPFWMWSLDFSSADEDQIAHHTSWKREGNGKMKQCT